MSDCRQCADFEWCKEYEECGLFKPKPMTNYDRLISKTPEELAILCEDGCPPGAPICNSVTTKERCQRCWLSWLKAPVEVSE